MYANIFSGESRARPLCDKFPASGTRAPLPSPERITTYRSLETTHVRHCMSYNGKCCRVKCVEVKKALLFHSWLSTYQLWKWPCVKVFAWTNYTLNLKKQAWWIAMRTAVLINTGWLAKKKMRRQHAARLGNHKSLWFRLANNVGLRA